jgi:hypothetical protein
VGNAQMLGAGGFLSLSVPDLAIGSHAFRAIYAGSNAYRGSASESLEQGVGKVHTTATVTRTAGSDPSLVGDPVVFTVTIAAVQQRGVRPTGTVTFTVDGRVVGEPVTLDAKGEARFTASSLTEGRHVVRAIYSGSERFASVQSANVTQTVN